MRSSELKSALILTLLVMILMRLVWMDLRSYDITYAPQNRYAFDRSEVSSSCRRSFSLRQIGPDRPTQGSWDRPGWADSWLYQGLVLASCHNGVFHDAGFVRYNQGLLIGCLVFCVLLTRVMARSWIVGLIVAVALLSRGRLISANGQISGDPLFALGLAFWAALIAHWLRSGSRLIFLGSYGVICALITLDPGAGLIGLALPIVVYFWRPIIRRKMQQLDPALEPATDTAHGNNRDLHLWNRWGELLNLSWEPLPDPARSGGLFRPLADGVRPLIGRTGYLRGLLPLIWLGFGLILVVLASQIFLRKFGSPPPLSLSRGDYFNWLGSFLSPLDRDLSLSLIMMLLALTWRSRWLPVLRPLLNVVGLAMLLNCLGALVLDLIYLPVAAARLWQAPRLLIVWEPVLMTLGILAFYQMLLSLLARFDRQRDRVYFSKIWNRIKFH